ncbi:DUF1688 family protein [Roseibium sp. SCPC15]|uniref:DUF1688 family protein n=1 Tax=Roseibium sp. SCP15 TaxID=3141376 RepID=UPI003339054F
MNAANSPLELFRPEEVRRKAHLLLEQAVSGSLAHAEVDLSGLQKVLVSVLEATKESYPDFHIPPYGVWRDFEAGGIDRWGALASAREFQTAEEMLAASADLAVLACFMKTQAPENWVFKDPMTGTETSGNEASALAAFHMFAAGSFSTELSDPYRVDAQTLIRMDMEELASGLQWSLQDDVELLEAMQRHLKRLGEALALRPDLFSEEDVIRPGLLAIRLAAESDGAVNAEQILDNLLEALAPVWEGGAQSDEITFGDSFRLSSQSAESYDGIIPFHMSAQEMVYSMVEPFAWAGLEVDSLAVLTAPADDAHVALFSDAGVLRVRSANRELAQDEALDRMIELRAVGSALTDKLADRLRDELEVPAEQLPLTCILEGGTSRAGNRILQLDKENCKKLGQYLNPGSVFWLPFGA